MFLLAAKHSFEMLKLMDFNNNHLRYPNFLPLSKFESGLSPRELQVYWNKLRLTEPEQNILKTPSTQVSHSNTDTPFLNSMISVRPRDLSNNY